MAVGKLVTSALLLSTTIYLATLLVSALLSEVTPSHGLKNILSNPWATSALVDYVVGMPFVFANISTRARDTPMAIFLCILCFLGGNVITVPLAVWWMNSHNSDSSALESHSGLQARDKSGIRFLQLSACASLVAFIAICAVAFASETPADGWRFIENDIWSKVAFVDVLTGIQLVIVYVIAREAPKSLLMATAWVTAVVFLGNGGTNAYILYLICCSPNAQSLKGLLSVDSTLYSSLPQ